MHRDWLGQQLCGFESPFVPKMVTTRLSLFCRLLKYEQGAFHCDQWLNVRSGKLSLRLEVIQVQVPACDYHLPFLNLANLFTLLRCGGTEVASGR